MAKARQNGEGSVYKRKSDGLWIGSVTLGWEAGKRRRKTVSGHTAEEVRAKLREVRRHLDKGLPVPDHKTTVDDLLDRWFKDVMSHQVAPNALQNYETIAKHHIRPVLGRRPLAKLSVAEIDALLSLKRTGDPKAGVQPLSVSTVRRVRAVLAQALAQAQRWDMVPRNVATLSTAPKQTRSEGRTLSPEQARTLLDALRGHRLEALYVTMLGSGLRRGEALGLLWSDVDLKGETLTVNHQLKRERGVLVLGDVKTQKSRRAVNLPKTVVEALKVHRNRQKEERLHCGPAWEESGHVFTTMIGTPIDPRNIGRDFASVTEAAGLGHWHPHELRHSALSLMLARGVPIEVVSNVAGHASIRMTADVYGHIMEPQRQAAATALDAVLSAS
jgi:integrase